MDHDPEKLEQVVTNLLSNAIKFSPEGGVVSVKVRKYESVKGKASPSHLQTSTLPNHSLLFAVSDTGPGIAVEEQERIFERFYQGENGQAAQTGGTGVGLALSKELVALMGGEIGVESEKGKGSRFWLRLPIHREAPMAAEAAPAAVEKAEPLSASAHENGRLPLLLIVEDNEDVLRYEQMMLQQEYRLAFARNGQEGWEQARELQPDLILSDVMMPGMDGFELCEKVKSDWHTSHIPVILLTAKADQASRVSGLQHGADAYLAKPFDKTELLTELKKLRSLRQQLQQRYALPGFELPSGAEPSPDDRFMEKIRSFLLSRMEDDTFKLDEVWTEMGMSRSSLYRKFKALTGLTLADYLLSLRLHAAGQLLRKRPDLSVSEVAFEAGFKSLSHFSRSYQKAFGHSPSEGRKPGGNERMRE
jgi:CheY-like chemotaxis protein/AraC-like DNA-binding protein